MVADVASALAEGAPLGKVAQPFEDGLMLWDFDTGLALAYSTSGVLLLSGSVSVGATIEGYLDVTVRPVLDVNRLLGLDSQVALGTPCPEGVGDCGAKMEAMCLGFDAMPICSIPCAGVEDCVRGGAQCFASNEDGTGFCLRACQSDADCVLPLQCREQSGASICL